MEPVKILNLSTDTELRTLDVVRFIIMVTFVAIEFFLLSKIWLIPSNNSSVIIFNGAKSQICSELDLKRWSPIYEIAFFNLVVLCFGFVAFVFFNKPQAILLGTTSIFILIIAFTIQISLAATRYRYKIVLSDCTVKKVQNQNFILFKGILLFITFVLAAFSPFSKLGDSI